MRFTLVVLALLTSSCGPEPEAERITVFAAASLRETLTEIAQEWAKRGGSLPQLQFEATSTLARQIEEGAPADLFIPADEAWMDPAKPLERRDWLGNRLVCVVPKEAEDFDLKRVKRLALADEQVPAGKYAKAALAHFGIKPAESTIYGNNVRDVLSKVSQGGADAAIVYATDAAIDRAVRIAFAFPPDSHPKIIYPAGLLTERGRAFFNALREPWAFDIARRRGFRTLQN
jgi:molybdate transport system substrate-binding protein